MAYIKGLNKKVCKVSQEIKDKCLKFGTYIECDKEGKEIKTNVKPKNNKKAGK